MVLSVFCGFFDESAQRASTYTHNKQHTVCIPAFVGAEIIRCTMALWPQRQSLSLSLYIFICILLQCHIYGIWAFDMAQCIRCMSNPIIHHHQHHHRHHQQQPSNRHQCISTSFHRAMSLYWYFIILYTHTHHIIYIFWSVTIVIVRWCKIDKCSVACRL